MTKYYILEWPESQMWSDLWHKNNELDIRLLDDNAVAVECSLLDYYNEEGCEPVMTKELILKKLSEAVSGTEQEFYSCEELNTFAEFYLDKWDIRTSQDVIAESFVDFFSDSNNECRRCSVCGKLMKEGYCVNMGDDYYCSDECLHENFTDSEWEVECNENDQSYWTMWE